MAVIEQLRFRFPRAVAAVEPRLAFMRKAVSFGLVGLVNTLLDFGMFWLFAWKLALPLVAANMCSWSIAVSCSYVMNSMFTFAVESGRRLSWRSYATFVVSGIAGLIANTAVLVIAAKLAPLVFTAASAQLAAAKACAVLASFVVNFSLSHFVVFRRRPVTAGD
ncbi:MAG TPA: GtrA family protein [Xanthobacteraceae bacterium]|jgi:putative flippase GtrA